MHKHIAIAATLGGALFLTFAQAVAADDMATLEISDAYARAASPAAKAGAAFFEIANLGDVDDRLVGVETPVAIRAELHTHIMNDGVMMMRHDEDGFEIPATSRHLLERGGDHVMLMGLTQALTDGVSFPLTLIFENAGPMTIEVTVDLQR